MKVMLVCERNNLLDAIIYIHNTAIQASSHENSLLSSLLRAACTNEHKINYICKNKYQLN
jgi:hypothetical protein